MIFYKKNILLNDVNDYIKHHFRKIRERNKNYKIEYLILEDLFIEFDLNVIDDELAFKIESKLLSFNNIDDIKNIFDKYIKNEFLLFDVSKRNLIIQALINILLDQDFDFIIYDENQIFYGKIDNVELFIKNIINLLIEYQR